MRAAKVKVTSLKLTKKNKVSVYVDGEYVFNLPAELVLKFNLKAGSELDEKILNDVIYKTQIYKIKEKALNILSYRARSCGEMRNKLKEEFSEEFVTPVIQKLKETGLLDDEKFSMEYALHLYRNKGYSINRIKYELRNKMVDSEVISMALNNLNLDEDYNLERIIEKKNFSGLISENKKKKAISYLLRLGYSWQQVKRFFK